MAVPARGPRGRGATARPRAVMVRCSWAASATPRRRGSVDHRRARHCNIVVHTLKAGAPVSLAFDLRDQLLLRRRGSAKRHCRNPDANPRLGRKSYYSAHTLDYRGTRRRRTDDADAVRDTDGSDAVLEAIGASPRRTIRMALWGGEEEGLLGSRAYALRHYAGDANADERDRLSVYLNQDPGTGPIYGWYLEGNDAVRPIFDAWLAPFADLGARRNVLARIGSTRPSLVHGSGPARVQHRAGLPELRHARASHQHGFLRPRARRRPQGSGDRAGVVRVACGNASRQDSRQVGPGR